jgi:hypothetical protein
VERVLTRFRGARRANKSGDSLPARNEWGESWREGNLNKTGLLSPALSSLLRQEEREKCSAIGLFLTCIDTNAPPRGRGPG